MTSPAKHICSVFSTEWMMYTLQPLVYLEDHHRERPKPFIFIATCLQRLSISIVLHSIKRLAISVNWHSKILATCLQFSKLIHITLQNKMKQPRQLENCSSYWIRTMPFIEKKIWLNKKKKWKMQNSKTEVKREGHRKANYSVLLAVNVFGVSVCVKKACSNKVLTIFSTAREHESNIPERSANRMYYDATWYSTATPWMHTILWWCTYIHWSEQRCRTWYIIVYPRLW